MEHSATHTAEMATTVLGLFAGKAVPVNSETMVHTVINQNLMGEEQVLSISVITVRNGELFGTLSAELASTTSHAAFAHLTAHLE